MKKHIRLLVWMTALCVCAGTASFQFVSAQTIDPLNNQGFEQQDATSEKALDWQDYGSGYSRVNDYHSGAWSIRLRNTSSNQISGAYQRIDLQQTEKKPVLISAYAKANNVVNSANGNLGVSIYTEIHLKDGSIAYWNTVPNFGTFDWQWIGFNTGTLPQINQPIDYLLIIPVLGNASGTAYFDDITIVEYQPTSSALTIMFDDGNISDTAIAKPLMDPHQFVGSSAIVTSFVGDEDFMDINQIKSLEANGWEIVSHTVTHADLSLLTKTQIETELKESKDFLVKNGLTINNVALPYGAFNGLVLNESSRLYQSTRRFEQGNNPLGVFPHEIKVQGLTIETTNEQVSEWIQNAQLKNEWVVLVFHKLGETGDDAYHTTPAQFAQIIDIIKNSGINVITYDQGIKQFAAKPHAITTPQSNTPPPAVTQNSIQAIQQEAQEVIGNSASNLRLRLNQRLNRFSSNVSVTNN